MNKSIKIIGVILAIVVGICAIIYWTQSEKSKLEKKIQARSLALACHEFYLQNDRLPKNKSELIQFVQVAYEEAAGSELARLLDEGEFIYLDHHDDFIEGDTNAAVLIYHRDCPVKGGVVAFQSVLVETVSADEFKKSIAFTKGSVNKAEIARKQAAEKQKQLDKDPRYQAILRALEDSDRDSYEYRVLLKLKELASDSEDFVLRLPEVGSARYTGLPKQIELFEKQIKAVTFAEFPTAGFPQELLVLKELQGLEFINCNLSRLPDEIEQFSKLEVLVAEGNELRGFPEVVLKLPRLRILRLGSNPFAEVPADIKKLENLTYLDFDMCYDLTGLPEELAELGKLNQLRLWQCQVSDDDLPTILKLKKLRELEIGGTQLSKEAIAKIKKQLPDCDVAD